MNSRIWINETLLSPMSRGITVKDVEIVKEARTASGKLVTDVVAVKKKFVLTYKFVTHGILQTLANLYSTSKIATLKIEQPEGTIEVYSVRFRPFSRARYLIGNEWYWEGISIELEEV